MLLHGGKRVIVLALLLGCQLCKLLLGALVLGVLGFEGSAVCQGILDVAAQRFDLSLQHAVLLLGVSQRMLRGIACLQCCVRLLL